MNFTEELTEASKFISIVIKINIRSPTGDEKEIFRLFKEVKERNLRLNDLIPSTTYQVSVATGDGEAFGELGRPVSITTKKGNAFIYGY